MPVDPVAVAAAAHLVVSEGVSSYYTLTSKGSASRVRYNVIHNKGFETQEYITLKGSACVHQNGTKTRM